MPTDSAPSLPARPPLLIATNAGLLLMVFLWGSFFPVLERLLRSWDIYSVTAGRQLLAGAVLLAVIALQERRLPLRRDLPWRRLTILGVGGLAVSSLLMTLAVFFAGAVSAAIVSATNPISSAITARLLYKAPVARGILVGTALSVAGGLLAVIGGGGDLADFRGGEILIIAANVVWTWYSVAAQRWLKGFSQVRITGLTILPGALCLLALALIMGLSGAAEIRIDLSPPALLLLLYAGVMPLALGNLLWHNGVKQIGVTIAAMYNNLIPVAAVLVTMWFGIYPTALQIAGGAVILAGVFYAQMRALRAQA